MHHSDVPFHDFHLVGLRCVEPRGMRLSFVLVGGAAVDLLLHEVDAFRCDNFQEGNIVFRVEEPDKASIRADEIAHMIETTDPSHKYVRRLLNRITAGELRYLRIGSSYGAEIMAACGRIEVIHEETSAST